MHRVRQTLDFGHCTNSVVRCTTCDWPLRWILNTHVTLPWFLSVLWSHSCCSIGGGVVAHLHNYWAAHRHELCPLPVAQDKGHRHKVEGFFHLSVSLVDELQCCDRYNRWGLQKCINSVAGLGRESSWMQFVSFSYCPQQMCCASKADVCCQGAIFVPKWKHQELKISLPKMLTNQNIAEESVVARHFNPVFGIKIASWKTSGVMQIFVHFRPFGWKCFGMYYSFT